MSRLFRLVLPGLVFWSCTTALPGADGKLAVLTSFLPVYCLTVNVAGDFAEVENLLPANVEPHDYQFSRKDLQKLSRADLVVINGLGLENWLEKAVERSVSGPRKRIVELAAGLESQLIYPTSGSSKELAGEEKPLLARRPKPSSLPNPHIWLDPLLATHAVTNILNALQQADPGHAQGYALNAARYLARLHQLDAELRLGLAPLRSAPVVTYHDAFAYFARRYGLNVVGVIEPMPDVEPSLKYLASLYRTVRSNPVQAIFTEPPAPSRLARQIGVDLRIPLAELDPLEAGLLTPTAYEERMRENLRILLRYLKPNAQRQST